MNDVASPVQPANLAEKLDADADWLTGEHRSAVRKIEALEREIVEWRGGRDEALRKAVESRAAANILRSVGLRASLNSEGVPVVAVDSQDGPQLQTLRAALIRLHGYFWDVHRGDHRAGEHFDECPFCAVIHGSGLSYPDDAMIATWKRETA